MRRLFIFACCAVLLCSAGAQTVTGIRYQSQVNNAGVPTPTIRVCTEPASGNPCSPLASIFSNTSLTTPMANPFTGDVNGNYFFYASPQVTYHVQIFQNGVLLAEQPDVSLSGSFTCGSPTSPGILFFNGTTCVVDPNATLDGQGTLKIAKMGIGITPLYRLHVETPVAGDVVAKFKNTDPTGYGVKFVPGLDTNYGIAVASNSAEINNFTVDGLGNLSANGTVTSNTSVNTPQVNTGGLGFLLGPFKTQTAPALPPTGFMECWGDSGTNLFSCQNPDGSNAMPSAGGGITLQTNGVANGSSTLLNFTTPSAFNGLTLTPSNPSGGIETFALGGSLDLATQTHNSTTVNGATCTLGGSCSVSGSAPVVVAGSSDTRTTAGTFSTQTSITAGTTSFFEIRAHGVLTTTGTTGPIENIQVNAFGTTGICNHGTANNTLNLNLTNDSWDVVCFVHILSTGAPGTATTWGTDTAATSNTNGGFASKVFPQNAVTVPATTTTAQTVSIQLVNTPVSGQSFTLQSLIVRGY